MKILILNPILFSGNGNVLPKVKSIKDTMIYNMGLGFVNNGHDVTLLAIDDYTPTEKEVYKFDILFFKNNISKIAPSSLPCSVEMNKYIKEYGHDFDLIIASEVFGFHTLTAAVYSPCNTIVWHELVKHQKKFFSIPSKIWHNVVVSLFYKKIRLVIPRSDASYNFISKYLKQVSKVSVDHGINISNFKTATNKKRQFISIAQLIKRKNIDSIIRKFHSFVSNPLYSDFQLLLAGRGDEEPKLQKLVENLKLENNVHFLGFLTHTELNEYVSESYASLIDTYNDLNMVSIPEAIVSGTPIITNLVPALAEFINVEGLGIAKQGWGISDMEEIVQNDNYHNNCLKWRDKLSTEQAAEKLVSLFLSANH